MHRCSLVTEYSMSEEWRLSLSLSVFGLAALTVLAVYVSTASRGIRGGDSGELVAEACHLGTPHPPGYPLLTLLMAAALRAIPHSSFPSLSPAYIANGLSAVFSSVAVYFIGKCVHLLSSAHLLKESNAGAVLAMGLMSFSPLFWQFATTAEVFALNNLLVALLLYLTLLFMRRKESWILAVGALVCGLGLSNQHTIVLLEAPLILWMLFLSRKLLYQRPWILIVLASSFLLGLLPYLYLLYIGSHAPKPGSWGHLATIEGFLHHFLRKDYGTFQLYSGNVGGIKAGLVSRTIAYFEDLTFHQGLYLTPALAAIGTLISLYPLKFSAPSIQNPPMSSSSIIDDREASFTPLLLVLCLPFYLLVFHSLSNLPLDDPLLYGVHQRFWMQPSILVFIFSGVGANLVAHVLLSSIVSLKLTFAERAVKAFFLLTALSVVFLQLSLHYYSSNQSENVFFSNYASAIVNPLPRNAVLLVNYDQLWTSLRYMHICEGLRSDVTLINMSMMSFRWFRHQIPLFPSLNFPGDFLYSQAGITRDKTPLRTFTLSSLVTANIDSRPIFLVGKLSFPDSDFFALYELVPSGLAQKVVRINLSPSAKKHSKANDRDWNMVSTILPSLPDEKRYKADTWEWTLARDFIDRLTDTASYRLSKAVESTPAGAGTPEALISAVYFLESAIALESGRNFTIPSYLYKNAGLAHVHLIQRKDIAANILPPPTNDPFRTLPLLAWPTGEWTSWSSDRFVQYWGKFLKRKDAKADPQYQTIKSMYITATNGKKKS